jgi:hypothetical protein
MADGIVVDEHQWQRGEYCMEPPPDAMENVAALFTAKALGEAKTTDPKTGATGEGKGEAEFMRSMATAMAPLLRRSQGLQWARDYMTFLCNSHQNRRLSKEEYKELTKIIIDKSFELINKEIEHLPKFEISLTGGLPPPPAAPGATKTSGTTSPDSMGAGTVRPPVPVMMSPTPEVPTVKPDTKPTASPIKSFFQRLWNW